MAAAAARGRPLGARPAPGGRWASALPALLAVLALAVAGAAAAAEPRASELRVSELRVPARVQLRAGAWAELRCHWELPRGAALYSAKWYKDGQEFFRFMPDERPPNLAFPVPGVHLQDAHSAEALTLRDLSVRTAGVYRCEVSTEGPAFRTAFAQQRMMVESPPPGEPQVTGVRDAYAPGDMVRANCTAGRSHPPPQLTWYINGIKAERWLPGRAPAPLDDADASGLVRRTLPLTFRAERRLFQGPGARLELRCHAVAGGMRWTRLLSPALAVPAPPAPAPHQTELREPPGGRAPPPPPRAGGQRACPGAAVSLLLLPHALAAAS